MIENPVDEIAELSRTDRAVRIAAAVYEREQEHGDAAERLVEQFDRTELVDMLWGPDKASVVKEDAETLAASLVERSEEMVGDADLEFVKGEKTREEWEAEQEDDDE